MIQNAKAPTHPLSEAEIGLAHTVCEVAGNDECACRLYEMGFGAGAQVTLEAAGNHAIVRVGETKLAIAGECLARVTVLCDKR